MRDLDGEVGSTTSVSAQLTSMALKGCNLTSASDELWILYTAIMVLETSEVIRLDSSRILVDTHLSYSQSHHAQGLSHP